MAGYKIIGGKPLSGDIAIRGGKNAVLPILAATILNNGQSVIHNCPKISDSVTTCKILESLGCNVKWEKSTMTIDSSTVNNINVPDKMVIEMRSSIIFLGALIGRFKNVRISYPGGCELGARPIDLHLKAFKKMGLNIKEEKGFLVCKANKITGAEINLDFPSVGATENIMLAACLAEGKTVINNAAREPEIIDLQNFLNQMGAKIEGAGNSCIQIQAVKKLHDVEYTVMPDRIVAGTYLAAAAITGGNICLKNINSSHINPITSKFVEAGCDVKIVGKELTMKAPARLRPIHIRTHPHPGFPTDMQPQMTAMLTRAEGTSIIIETVFDSRFKYIDELRKMGADVFYEGKLAVVNGKEHLSPARVVAKDLRGGASLILAALNAPGESFVIGSHFVERGYESIQKDLRTLGADIEHITIGSELKG